MDDFGRHGVLASSRYNPCSHLGTIHPATEGGGTPTWRYIQTIHNDAGVRGRYRDRLPVPLDALPVVENDGAVWADGRRHGPGSMIRSSSSAPTVDTRRLVFGINGRHLAGR